MKKGLSDIKIIKKHFAKADTAILKVLKTLNLDDWFKESSTDDHFINLSRNIIYQQLAGKAADAIYTRFIKLVGSDLRPETVLNISDQAMRDVGLSWAKAKYVKDLATKTLSGEVNLDNLEELDNEEIIQELTKVKGIGRWTAEMFLLFTLHRENIFSYGDLGLRKGFGKLYGVESPRDEEIQKVVDKWIPYQSYGSISLWHYLDNR